MKNILSEYDKSPGIISPDFEKMDLHLPKKAVFAFLGEKRIERFAPVSYTHLTLPTT